jgi:hypothetical protein
MADDEEQNPAFGILAARPVQAFGDRRQEGEIAFGVSEKILHCCDNLALSVVDFS